MEPWEQMENVFVSSTGATRQSAGTDTKDQHPLSIPSHIPYTDAEQTSPNMEKYMALGKHPLLWEKEGRQCISV